MNDLRITNVRFASAKPEDHDIGLVGYVSATINRLRVDGITIHHAADDHHLVLSFPAKKDRAGRKHFYLRPENDEARREIEYQIFAALGIQEISR